MPTRHAQRFFVGLAYSGVGVTVLVALAVFSFPRDWEQFLADWALFAFAFLLLEWRSVEVNDRLNQSSSVMVALTAGVILAMRDQQAAFGMALMAAMGPLVPADIRDRRVFQPAANFGQLVVTAAASGMVLDLMLKDLGRPLAGGPFSQPDLLQIATAGALAAIVYTVVNGTLVRLAVRLVYGRREVMPWSSMGLLVSSHLLMGILGGLLGAVLILANDGVLPLVLLVYVIGHLALSSYSQLREAHESTLRGFVKTLEARDLYTRGHTERVAFFCQLIGEELGFTGTQLERMRWAALIHDLGKLAVPAEVIGKRGRLDGEEFRQLRVQAHRVEDALAEVDFLRPMVQLASGFHPHGPREDYGQKGHRHVRQPTLEMQVLGVADAFDAMTSSRRYRMSMGQEAAFAEMRADPSPLFDEDVIAALERALDRIGQRYGPARIQEEEADDDRALADQGARE